ncbi:MULTISPECIES: caspase family protein [Microbacterium]|uniref:caspase family protein n=1 Tax=Microbacterium TaxID=33882 RepID=UPI00285A89E7|nr:caspase family protein [Microbacterium trichothecenolyticum]MDR7184899.1 hypothetical protein [Microbacterium trichothecenolyticum]
MNGPVARVLLIGVPAPPPIRSTNERKLAYGKTAVGFPELDTVPEELEWFDDLLTARLGERNMSLTRVVSPANTTSEKVRKAITEAVSLEPVPPLLILYLAGHGVQFERPADDDGAATSLNGSRRFDEAFATSDGYVLDRELKRMLDAKPATTRLIAFVDTCHADGMLGVRGVQALDIVEELAEGEFGRLVISSSRKTMTAPELRQGGVLSTTLRRIVEDPENVRTYRTLCASLARVAAEVYQQQIVVRYTAADGTFLDTMPFASET